MEREKEKKKKFMPSHWSKIRPKANPKLHGGWGRWGSPFPPPKASLTLHPYNGSKNLRQELPSSSSSPPLPLTPSRLQRTRWQYYSFITNIYSFFTALWVLRRAFLKGWARWDLRMAEARRRAAWRGGMKFRLRMAGCYSGHPELQ